MKVLILEDENAAAKRLQKLLQTAEPQATVVAILESIQHAKEWLNQNPQPDIILSDMHLADGLALELFQQCDIRIPVIFTTAYDAYTLKAFKLNSVDYLLKPIDIEELKAALEKYRLLNRQSATQMPAQFASLLQQMSKKKDVYKSRFLVKLGDRLSIIPTSEVAFVRADDKVVFLHTNDGKKHLIDDSLDDLMQVLDPATFFRINRTYIAPLTSIDKIHNHFNGRLKLELKHTDDKEIFVSRARVADFKKWLNS